MESMETNNTQNVLADAIAKVILSNLDYSKVVGGIMAEEASKKNLIDKCASAVADSFDDNDFEDYIATNYLDKEAMQDRVVDRLCDDVNYSDVNEAIAERVNGDICESDVVDAAATYLADSADKDEIKQAAVDAIMLRVPATDVLEIVKNIVSSTALDAIAQRIDYDKLAAALMQQLIKALQGSK